METEEIRVPLVPWETREKKETLETREREEIRAIR